MFLETEKKSCGNFQTNTDTCGQALKVANKATPTALGTWDACYFLKAILSIFLKLFLFQLSNLSIKI